MEKLEATGGSLGGRCLGELHPAERAALGAWPALAAFFPKKNQEQPNAEAL